MIRELLTPTKKNNYEAWLVQKPALIIYTLVFLFSAHLAPADSGMVLGVSANNITVNRLEELLNAERENAGLKPLRPNEMLSEAATAKALDMLDKNYWDHFGPGGETPWDFIRGAGYTPYKVAGENLAKGFQSAEGIHQAWMASPTHRANIMEDRYSDVGFAVIHGTLLGENVTLVVQMFGTLEGDNYPDSNTSVDLSSFSADTVEQGDVSSIRIESPVDGSVITDDAVPIMGSITPAIKGITLSIYDGNARVAHLESEMDGGWYAQRESAWDQGEHEITVAVDDTDISETTSFIVDSVSPQLTPEDLDIRFEKEAVKVEYLAQEDDVTALLTVGGQTYVMERSLLGLSATIPLDLYESTDSTIEAVDQHGNKSRLALSEATGQGLLGLKDVNLTTSSFKVLFTITLVLLIAIQAYYYMKLGLMHTKANQLFSLSVWILIVVVTVITKSSGSIG